MFKVEVDYFPGTTGGFRREVTPDYQEFERSVHLLFRNMFKWHCKMIYVTRMVNTLHEIRQ